MGGDINGLGYQWETGEDNDNGSTYQAVIKSTQWNPFIQLGQKTQFGYIDFYFSEVDRSEGSLTLNFYVDNKTIVAASRTISFSDSSLPSSSDGFLYRVYINLTGQFIRMEINSNGNNNFQIRGLVLWAREAGRFTP